MEYKTIEEFIEYSNFEIIKRNDDEHDCHSLYIYGNLKLNIDVTYHFYADSDFDCEQKLLDWANDEI